MELLNLPTICLLDYSRIDIVIDSYFDGPLKPHTLQACDYGQFYPFTEVTDGLLGKCLKYQWNKVALNSFLSFLAGNLLRHDFSVAIIFISVKSEDKGTITQIRKSPYMFGSM